MSIRCRLAPKCNEEVAKGKRAKWREKEKNQASSTFVLNSGQMKHMKHFLYIQYQNPFSGDKVPLDIRLSESN